MSRFLSVFAARFRCTSLSPGSCLIGVPILRAWFELMLFVTGRSCFVELPYAVFGARLLYLFFAG